MTMILNKRSFILFFSFCFFLGCKKEDSNPAGPTIVAAEVWEFVMNNDSTNHGQTTFEKKSTGCISGKALWYYNYQGATVQCPFEGSTVAVVDTFITVEGQGTATNPSAPQGYQTSSFAVHVYGIAKDGVSAGTWKITFTTQGWPSAIEGTYTAKRISGGGVTQ